MLLLAEGTDYIMEW